MFNHGFRIFIYALIVLCTFLPSIEFYYPENFNYQDKVVRKLGDMERQLLLLEKTMRSISDSLENSEDTKTYLGLISLSHRVVKRTEIWQKDNSFSGGVSQLGIEYDNLFRKVSFSGTGKLLTINGNLCLAIPFKAKSGSDEIFLSYIEESEFHSVRPDGTREFFFPDLALGEVAETNDTISSQNPYKLSGNLLSGLKSELNVKSVLNLNDVKYNSYYSSQKKSNFGFLDGLLFIRTGYTYLNYYYFLLLFLLPVAIVDLFVVTREFSTRRAEKSTALYGKELTNQFTILKGIETEGKSQVRENEPEPIRDIELQEIKSEGKRIFILPFDIGSEKNSYLTPAFLNRAISEENILEKKMPAILSEMRDRIFNPELKDLIKKTERPPAGRSPEDSVFLRYAKWFKRLIPEKNEKVYHALNTLYDKDFSDQEVLSYLNAIVTRFGMKAFTIHIHQKVFGCYSIAYSGGIDVITRNNLLFESDDQYLGKCKDGIIHIGFDISHIQDKFFLKKFSKEILSSYSGLLALPLQNHGIDGFFILFYPQEYNRGNENLQDLRKMIDAMIHPIVPVISGIAVNKFQVNIPDNDILVKLYHLMKEVTEGGSQKCSVIKLSFLNYPAIQNRESLRMEIISGVERALAETERVAEVSASEFLIFIRNTDEKIIREIILDKNKNSFDISFQSQRFPDEGKNYYTYF